MTDQQQAYCDISRRVLNNLLAEWIGKYALIILEPNEDLVAPRRAWKLVMIAETIGQSVKTARKINDGRRNT